MGKLVGGLRLILILDVGMTNHQPTTAPTTQIQNAPCNR